MTSAVAARSGSDRWTRVRAPLATYAALGATTVALHLRDPHEPYSWGVCPSFAAFGLYCPGCGGLRAVHDLTNLELGAALTSNPVLVLLMPALVAVLALWGWRAWVGDPRSLVPRSSTFWVVAGSLLALYTLLRNLPPLAPWMTS